MSGEWYSLAIEEDAGFEVVDFIGSMPAFFGPGDVARLAACCPELKMLSIPGLVAPGVDLTPLLSLQQLQYLFVGGEVVDDAVASSVLAKMTQLMRLKVFGAPQLTDQGLLALTSRKKLIELEIGGCGFNSTLSNEDQEGYVSLHHDEGGPPDVWMQLLARCLRSDVCLKEATAQLLAYHAEVEKGLELAYAHMRADAEHYASVCGSDDDEDAGTAA
uniref:Uncharacterized protein n=1 Tax=Tetradesmus obliquus TaxID=3088 RepID=A0A383W1S6_TETOB|eukprot:jgi/Sobl393_1/5188/SZX71073.1